MPRKPFTFSPEMKIRIKKTSTMSLIEEIYSTQNFDSVNAIINAGLEKGLPIVSGKQFSLDGAEIASIVSEKVLDKLEPFSNSILFNLRKLAVLQTVQETMLSSLIQEFEFFLQTKGITLDEELLDEFRINLPLRFEEDKQELIARLFEAEEQRNEQNRNEDDEG